MAKNNVKIEIKADQFLKDIRKYDQEIQNKLDQNTLKAAFLMEGEIKASIAGQRAEPRSVDTGRFLNSVTASKTGRFSSKVFSDVEYADKLEYGTVKIPPRRHFRNSAIRNTSKVQQIIKDGVKEALR